MTKPQKEKAEGAGKGGIESTSPHAAIAESSASVDTLNQPRSGRWSMDEKLLFLHGLKLFGRGRWKKIRTFLPWRSLVQIKSHGQKVLNRADAGEDLWAPLREKQGLVQELVSRRTKSPNFIMPRIPSSTPAAPRRRQLPKPKLKPRPTSAPKDIAKDGNVHFSIGNGRRGEENGPAVFRTQFGGTGKQSFSFQGGYQQVQEKIPSAIAPSSYETTAFDSSFCRSPEMRNPNVIKSTAVLAATALCQLSEGWEKSSDEHRVNIVSP